MDLDIDATGVLFADFDSVAMRLKLRVLGTMEQRHKSRDSCQLN